MRGLEPAPFRSRAWLSNHWAIPAPTYERLCALPLSLGILVVVERSQLDVEVAGGDGAEAGNLIGRQALIREDAAQETYNRSTQVVVVVVSDCSVPLPSTLRAHPVHAIVNWQTAVRKVRGLGACLHFWMVDAAVMRRINKQGS